MQKVMAIGCPGSGKSTFSKALHDAAGLPLCHLDMMKLSKFHIDSAAFYPV